MDELRGVLDQVLEDASFGGVSPDEIELRTKEIDRLFTMHDEEPGRKLALYVELTEEIPLSLLIVSIRGILRSHHWNRLPLSADIWTAARYAAGMHREQYHAGKYLPAATEWPPDGKRYAVTAGDFETLPATLAIGPGELVPQLTATSGG